MNQRPTYHTLLDRRVREALQFYAWIGAPSFPIAQAIAYIALLEEELARREAEDQR